MNQISVTYVCCPHCKSKTVYSSTNPYRPFCCERCKLLDLGAWADEHYRIPLQSGAISDDSLNDKRVEHPDEGE